MATTFPYKPHGLTTFFLTVFSFIVCIAMLSSCMAPGDTGGKNGHGVGYASEFSECVELTGAGYKLVAAPVGGDDLVSGHIVGLIDKMAGRESPLHGELQYYLFLTESPLSTECRRHVRMYGLDGHIITGKESKWCGTGKPRPLLYLVGPGGTVIDSAKPASTSDRWRIYRRVCPIQTDLRLSTGTIRTARPHIDTTVYIRNYGDKPGMVFETESTCSCTRTYLVANRIEPGDSVCLTVSYDRRKRGNYRSVVTFLTNSTSSPLQFVIEGMDA